MLSLVYVSSATRTFSEAELVALLRHSRDNNSRLDVTGILLYKDGNFMQLLEGPGDAVRKKFQSIEADDRHRGVIKLLEQQIELRQFSDWTMAFRNLDDPALREIDGYSDFLNEPLDSETFRKDPTKALRLVEIFRRNMR